LYLYWQVPANVYQRLWKLGWTLEEALGITPKEKKTWRGTKDLAASAVRA
jgi:hypothetical protein